MLAKLCTNIAAVSNQWCLCMPVTSQLSSCLLTDTVNPASRSTVLVISSSTHAIDCCLCNDCVCWSYALQGDAKAQICEFCEDQSMDLLVVTSTVRGRIKKALSPLGGVSSQLVLEAPCPVLVLPTQASSKRPTLFRVARAGLAGVPYNAVATTGFFYSPALACPALPCPA